MEFGKWLYYAGAVLIVAGALLTYFPGLVSWFGKLPGDIKIQNERWSVFIPLTSMLIVSVLLTLCARLLERYLGSGQ